MNEKLTPEQIENWRKALLWTFGPYAMIMSDEEVQKFRDRTQVAMDEKEISKDE